MKNKNIQENNKAGYNFLESITDKYRKGSLTILGGRPGMGKTSLVLYFSKIAAICNNPVLFFSIETSEELLWDRIEENKLPLYIDDNPNIDLDYIEESIQLYIETYSIKYVVIDTLQLIETHEKNIQNRYQAIGNVIRKLKIIARTYKIAIIITSQLNRNLENRPCKIPHLFDLRDSGDSEEVADNVLFTVRPDRLTTELNHSYFDQFEFEINMLIIVTTKVRFDGKNYYLFLQADDNFQNFYNVEPEQKK